MKIEEIKETDYQEIISLWTKEKGIVIRSKDDDYSGFLRLIKRNPHTCYLVKDQDKIIATLLAGYDGRRVTFYHVMVEHDYQKQGIGTMLVNHVLKQLKQKNITKINLMVCKENNQANHFWEKLNFKIREDIYYRDMNL